MKVPRFRHDLTRRRLKKEKAGPETGRRLPLSKGRENYISAFSTAVTVVVPSS